MVLVVRNQHFVGVLNNFILILLTVRKAFNFKTDDEALVYSKDYLIQPEIFSAFIAQFIDSAPDFELDIKLSVCISVETVTESPEDKIPDTETIIETIPYNNSSFSGEVESPYFDSESTVLVYSDEFGQLPSTQEIKTIDVVQLAFKVYQKCGFLENRERIQISKAILIYTLRNNKSIILTRDDFIALAQSIVDIFNTEVKETYYVPFRHGHLAKGKLYDAYNNYRTRLSAAGLIKRRCKQITKETFQNSKSTSDAVTVFSDIEILQSGLNDWSLILDKWKITHSYRQNELQNTNISTIDYFEKYSVLSKERNYELLEIDYYLLYPLSKTIYEWRSYFPHIIAKAEKLKDQCVQEILVKIKLAKNEDAKLALAFMLIPFLLPNSKRLSKLEVQTSFIQYCNNILAADDETREAIKRLKCETQPKIYLIGDQRNIVCLAYVDISGKRFKFENPIQAIEVCFHLFIGMHIKYPKTCANVWIFIQLLVFQIKSPWDVEIPSVRTLINDIYAVYHQHQLSTLKERN